MDKEREAGLDIIPNKDEIIATQAKIIQTMHEDITKLCNRVEHLEKLLAETSWQAELDRYYYESQPKETW